MSNHPSRRAPLAGALTIALACICLPGCVVTGANLQSTADEIAAPRSANARTRNPGEILIAEAESLNRPYIVIGNVRAWGRSLNLLSSNPTRADVDEALRTEAAKIGADAVIGVRYRTEREGLTPRGKMTAEGLAIRFREVP